MQPDTATVLRPSDLFAFAGSRFNSYPALQLPSVFEASLQSPVKLCYERKIWGHFVCIPLIKPLHLTYSHTSATRAAAIGELRCIIHLTAPKPLLCRNTCNSLETWVLFTAFYLNTLLKGGKGGQSNTYPALLFIFTVNIKILSEYSAPSEHFAVCWFLLAGSAPWLTFAKLIQYLVTHPLLRFFFFLVKGKKGAKLELDTKSS